VHRLLDRLRPSTFQEMTRQARNAEETLLAVLYCCASVAKQPSTINWPSEQALAYLLARLEQERSIATELLGWLDAPGQNLFWVSLNFGNLPGVNLTGSVLFGAGLFQAELSGAILVGASLTRADIEGANLTGADLAGAHLLEAVLYSANLRRANLEGTLLRDANLAGADLAGANLTGSNLEAANLVGANLDEVRGLDEVKSWRGAKIEGTWVERLGLDDEKLGLVVVKDLQNDDPEKEEEL
jgi:uncharacterized protein YjbI with pentapeptide repeats